MTSEKSDKRNRKEILPTGDGEGEPEGRRPAVFPEIVAQINEYTNRPDLLIGIIEKFDPGFVKRMNAATEQFSEKSRNARFKFGLLQAYTSLVIGALAACMCLACLSLQFRLAPPKIWRASCMVGPYRRGGASSEAVF
jgi:hypothetical protein